MQSRFLMQIIDRQTGEVVQWEPGLSVEREFVTDCVQKIIRLGVGLFRTEAHVAADIETGLEQAIFELKARVPQG